MAITKIIDKYKISIGYEFPKDHFAIIKADGRRFGKLTNKLFTGISDPEFNKIMRQSVYRLMKDTENTSEEIILSYVKSDEATFVIPPFTNFIKGGIIENVILQMSYLGAFFTNELSKNKKDGIGAFYSNFYAVPSINEIINLIEERQFDAYSNTINDYIHEYVKEGILSPNDLNGMKLEEKKKIINERKNFLNDSLGGLIYRKKTIDKNNRTRMNIKMDENLGLFKDNNPNLEKIILGSLREKKIKQLKKSGLI